MIKYRPLGAIIYIYITMERNFIMSRLTGGTFFPATQQECYGLVQKHSVNAFRYKKNGIENNYQREVKLLSRNCTLLINTFGESPQPIIVCMETAMKAIHGLEVKAINDEIRRLFMRRKNLPVNNAYCEREIADLTFHIDSLEQRKLTPITEIIQGIIFDALDRASRSDGAHIPSTFNIHEYQKPSVNLFL